MSEGKSSQQTNSFVRPKAFGDGIYDILLARMMSLEIHPGERMSVEKLSREFQISPTPIREALGRLEAIGLVVRTHLIGYSAAPRLTTKQFDDLFHLRLLIEPDLAGRAAVRADSLLIDNLRGTIEGMEEATAGRLETAFDQFARLDSRFHGLISVASDNVLINEVMTRLNVHIHIFRSISDGTIAASSILEHKAILAAIESGDPVKAEAAMRDHVESSRRNLSGAFGR